MLLPLPVARWVTRCVVKPVLGNRLSATAQRRWIDTLMRFPVLPKGARIERVSLAGVPTDRITTPGTDPQRALLYLHGGAYLVGSPTSHRGAATHLAHAAGRVGYVPDYRLAPEHPYPAAVDDALAAYRALLAAGFGADDIVVAGDSAGGGLALALALRLRQVDVPLPAALGLISPWVDLSLTGLDETVADPLLSRGWLELGASAYAGADRTHPEASPLHADPVALASMPPLFVHAASDEMFRADVERFVATARAAGVEVTYRRLEGHWHVTHLWAGMVREATEVVNELGGWLRGPASQALL